MIDKFEYSGLWWLPHKPEDKVSGTLRYTPGEWAQLDLVGSFKDFTEFPDLSSPEIIVGISSNGKNITLYKCWETNSRLSFPGFLTSSFTIEVLFVGCHFFNRKDIKFNSISVHFSNFDEWVNISGFIRPSEIDYSKGIVIVYKRPEEINVKINDEIDISIGFEISGPTFSRIQKEMGIKQKTMISIKTQLETTFEDFMKILNKLQNFIALGVMQPVYPNTIEAKTRQNIQMIEDKKVYPPVEIYYKQNILNRNKEKTFPHEMLFTLADIFNNFENFLKNWFIKNDILKPSYDLYFGTLYNPGIYLYHKFLNIVQAIESYHRVIYNITELSEEDHFTRINDIINVVPKKYTKWLNDKLLFSNEISLRKRLNHIYKLNSDIINTFIKNKKSFINTIVNTRNELTHQDSRRIMKGAKGNKLYEITEKLKLLLKICFLSEIGFSKDTIKILFLRNEEIRLMKV